MGTLTAGPVPITPTERSKVIDFGQGPIVDVPQKLVHEAFRNIAVQYPSTTAVEHNGRGITYAELDLASTQLSHRLIRLGIRPRDRVVLLAQRSIPLIVAILAVLKSGCQYVPLDGGVVPDSALEHVIADADPSFILCLPRYLDRAHRFFLSETQVLSLEEPWTSPSDVDVEVGQKISVEPGDGAYLIYTSGQCCLLAC